MDEVQSSKNGFRLTMRMRRMFLVIQLDVTYKTGLRRSNCHTAGVPLEKLVYDTSWVVTDSLLTWMGL